MSMVERRPCYPLFLSRDNLGHSVCWGPAFWSLECGPCLPVTEDQRQWDQPWPPHPQLRKPAEEMRAVAEAAASSQADCLGGPLPEDCHRRQGHVASPACFRQGQGQS